LADSILKLLRDQELRQKMGRAARDWVYENFTWNIVAEKMHRCYADLCGTKNRRTDIGILKA
jgi:glycosyltransferase involved in cell wall biosynthesis